jgi:hypothetical protein
MLVLITFNGAGNLDQMLMLVWVVMRAYTEIRLFGRCASGLEYKGLCIIIGYKGPKAFSIHSDTCLKLTNIPILA